MAIKEKRIDSFGLLFDGFRFEIGEFFLGSSVLLAQFTHLLDESETLLENLLQQGFLLKRMSIESKLWREYSTVDAMELLFVKKSDPHTPYDGAMSSEWIVDKCSSSSPLVCR